MTTQVKWRGRTSADGRFEIQGDRVGAYVVMDGKEEISIFYTIKSAKEWVQRLVDEEARRPRGRDAEREALIEQARQAFAEEDLIKAKELSPDTVGTLYALADHLEEDGKEEASTEIRGIAASRENLRIYHRGSRLGAGGPIERLEAKSRTGVGKEALLDLVRGDNWERELYTAEVGHARAGAMTYAITEQGIGQGILYRFIADPTQPAAAVALVDQLKRMYHQRLHMVAPGKDGIKTHNLTDEFWRVMGFDRLGKVWVYRGDPT